MKKVLQKKRCLSLKTFAVAVLMAIFVMPAKAQNVYMHSGSMTVPSSGSINFYDSGGESHGPDYYWERWFQRNEDFTFTFNPAEDGKKIKVTFNEFTAYLDNGGYNHAIGNNWSMRLNNAELSVYDGTEVNEDNLITTYTGNMTGAFSVMANGPITFYFHSYGYREEGWQATVQCVDNYELQKPQISFEACSDAIVINANNKGAEIYYTTTGNDPVVNDPLTGATLYEGPFNVAAGTTIKAIARLNNTNSAVASKQFTADDVTPTPGVPTIEREMNTITMTPAAISEEINETYYVWYTTDGSEPTTTNGQRYTGPFEWHTPGTVFKAVTRAESCSDKISTVVEFPFNNVKVITPTITFADGNATIACTMSGVTIYYTIDGSTPTTSSTAYTAPFAVSYGTTVKAIAVMGQEGFEDSEVATNIYVPEGGSGTDGTVVILDDREDHSWSYYSDNTQPIHSLKPADVKITYKGYGPNTMTSTNTDNLPANSAFDSEVTSSQVAVNVGETESQFIYLKTLENDNPEGGEGANTYSYTMISNPFQVRPTYEGGTTPEPTIETIDVVDGTGTNAYSPMYTDYANYGFKSEYIIPTSYFTEAGISDGDKLQSITLYQSSTGNWTATNLTIKLLNSTTGSYSSNAFVGDNGTTVYTNTSYSSGSQSTHTFQFNTPFEYSGNNLVIQISSGHYGSYANTSWYGISSSSGNRQSCYGNYTSNTDNTYSATRQRFLPKTTFTVQKEPISDNYRGFYAWRVKSLGGGLTITGKSVGDIIYPDEHIKFVTSNAKDNEVEFEALWAKAYVSTSALSSYVTNDGSYQNAYERNFLIGSTTILNVGYPCTYSSFYPNGTTDGTTPATTNNQGVPNGRVTAATRTATDDSKVENYILNGGTLNTGGYKVTIGRGATSSSNPSITPLSGTYTSATNAILRIESGSYGGTTNLYGTPSVGNNLVHLDLIFGSDYDRAKNDNSKLSISNSATIQHGGHTATGSSWISFQHLDIVVKSGSIQQGYWDSDNGDYAHTFYCRSVLTQTGRYPGITYLTVEGGEFASINGGRGNYAEGTANADDVVFSLRMKGGTVHGSIYGAASANPSWGGRRIVITKGMVEGWIAGGCNGTSGGGATVGESYIYIGGNAQVGNSANPRTLNGTVGGNVFGAGRGGEGHGTDANPASMRNSYIVVADNGSVLHNVYGGGEYGYTGCSSGDGGTDPNTSSNIYILGGTVQESVFGGGNMTKGTNTNINLRGGTVVGNLYGGSNENGTIQNVATINVSGGTVTNVFGGGFGDNTVMDDNTVVNVSGGTINNNVYGGGEEGKVNGNTNVTISGGTMKNVYGAGKGGESTALISGQTFVTVSGGTISESVYGGGEAGDVAKSGQLASTVTVSGGNIAGDVFGGGRMGKTNGNTEVDIKGGIIRGNVFGGAYGAAGTVYVAGTHSVNIMGGRIFSSVYGGSRNANDALAFTGYSQTEKAMSSVVNISAGQVDEQVYAAGYFGQTFGSVYVFVGKEAILNAPHCAPSFGNENENMYKTGKLLLAYNVWAGGDWGVFEGGSFGAPTVSGYSDIYVDGEGYDTQTSDESAPSYMNIKGSLLGCGTSCDAGTQGRGIYVRNYGHANSGSKEDFTEPFSNATRSFFSIQRADTLIIDNSHLNFTGQAKINSLDATEKYAIFSFDKTVRMTGGSSLFLNAPVFQIIDFWSATVDDLYNGINAVYTPIAYNGLGATGGPIDNKVRVNGGNYIEIYHDEMINGTTPGYGMLNGFAHMMVAEKNSDNTCAYARPKQCVPTEIANNLDNPSDGGWVSYNPDENTFSIGTYNNGSWNPVPNTGGSDQIPYENHTTTTKAGEQYFRIWRVGGMYSEREGVLNAYADGTESFNYVDVTIKLPAWRSTSAYYQFQTTGTGANLNTTIDYGPDVMTYATAIASTTGTTQNWVHFVEADNEQLTGPDATAQTQITQNPNVNFGLVTLAGAGMTLDSPVSSQGGLIVCPESDEFLAGVDENMETVNTFTCSDNTVEPQVTFRLTYSNQISTNMTWDPMFITLVQCDENGNITDIVKISLTINTYTTINNVFTTQTYAIMDGNHGNADTYTAKVILPTFTLHDYSGDLSQFTLTNVTFEPNNVDATSQECWEPKGSTYNFTHFAMEIGAARNEDNSDGWNGTATGTYDSHANLNGGIFLGETGARTPFAFDFTLTYNGNNNGVAFNEDSEHPALLGVLTFTIRFTNYENGNPNDNYSQNLTIKVQVIRRGVGKVFYLDGQNGSNANSALYPNDAALSLSYIFNRCGYLPGDIIYIVNTVDVNKNLEWSGSAYNGVTIYRYPGGHPLTSKQVTDDHGDPLYWVDEEHTAQTNTQTEWPVMYTPDIVGNEDNEAFTGTLLNVQGKGNLTIRDITLDGHMSDHTNPWTMEEGADAGVTANSPMITVASGGTLILTNGTMLQQNNSTANGGAVAVNDGGTLKMNQNASIMNNVTSGEGGAVYMAGTMIVSDAVQLINNTKGTKANNVYLTAADKVIQIGTSSSSDDYGELSAVAQIGVTKPLYGNVDGYTEVVKVESTNELDWLEDPYVRPNVIIFHDGHKYELEKYNDPTFLYWIGTWVTDQDWNPHYESAEAEGYDPDNFESHLDNIDTPEELAWFISYVNGYNGASVHQDVDATITADIDMNASIWVPIGNANTPYEGTFEGNGHVISGIHSILVNDDAAMFGVTDGATIQNVEAVVYFNGNSINKGTFIGTMNGGTLSNVGAAGELIGKANTINLGGLVGLAIGTTQTKPIIHSGFSMNTLTAEKASTVVGGLVGSLGDVVVDENNVTTHYYADLYNSYANVTLRTNNVATTVGGLVGINNQGCTVENCYVINPIGPAFAFKNYGTINICYAADGTTNYLGDATTNAPTKHGTYAAVLGRKDLGYMYEDNKVTMVGAAHDYITPEDTIYYAGGKIEKWRGLLSTLNQWVKANPKGLTEPAPWFRPTSADINGDLPLLGFHKDNSLSTFVYDKFADDYNYLHYGAFDATNNGLDLLLALNAGKSNFMFLYGKATKVVGETGSNKLFINEDAVLIQDPIASSKDGEPQYKTIDATVGITFDNSSRKAHDYYNTVLEYDWHMMSTPLSNAIIGATYDESGAIPMEFGGDVNITVLEDSYFPNGLNVTTPAPANALKWDFYNYYEPEYHWINLKRSLNNHWHIDGNHEKINYQEADQANGTESVFTPGKGYMMAIEKDSYMSSTGKLNSGNVPVTITSRAPDTDPTYYNLGWNLVGNPYQAHLDLSALFSDNDNTGKATQAYVYDADLKVYTPFVKKASENPNIIQRYVHQHQAFFTHAEAEEVALTFKPTMAVAEPAGNYSLTHYRDDEHINYPLVNLFAENAAGNRDLAVVEFNRPELGGATKINGLRNANFQIFAHMDDNNYGLLFTPEGTERVPVWFKTEEDGVFTLTWNTLHGDFTSLRLIDNLTGVNYDMLANDSYTFEAKTDDYASRFYITYVCTDIEEYNEGDDTFAFFDGSEWVINGKGYLEVVDVTGRVLFAERLSNDQNRISMNGYAKGVYLMRISDNKNVKVQKIVVR